MNTITFKGYNANIEYDAFDRIFVGRLSGIDDDIVVFHGSTVDELETAFHESVNHYIDVSERIGHQVSEPFSGRIILQIPPEIHSAVATAAEVSGKSINQWVSDVLGKAAAHA